MATALFPSSAEAQRNGYFSRRHKTRKESEEAKAEYEKKRRKEKERARKEKPAKPRFIVGRGKW